MIKLLNKIKVLLPALGVIALPSCKPNVEVPSPGTEIPPRDTYSYTLSATNAVTNIYGSMIKDKNGFASGGTGSVTFLGALAADELECYTASGQIREFYLNNISVYNAINALAIWKKAYQNINAANTVLVLLKNNHRVEEEVKIQLEGEVLFLRAFCHFILCNLYGDVPVVTTSNLIVNNRPERRAVTDVYAQVISDLKEAKVKLSKISDPAERIRVNSAAATALLARVYLYKGEWQNASQEAGMVIADNSRYKLDSLNGVFVKDSPETIWQLKPNTPGINTWEGNNFILNSTPATTQTDACTLSASLMKAFEPGDKRKNAWVGVVMGQNQYYCYPGKYRVKTGSIVKEYSVVLRLAEQYLIRAEARTHLGDLDGATTDLNVIRQRAGLPGVSVGNATALLDAIARERRIELFAEWGHRWFDLKRTGKVTDVMAGQKAGWSSDDALFPIPMSEIIANFNLTQNPGYN